MMRSVARVVTLVMVCAGAAAGISPASAQNRPVELLATPGGVVLDYPADGVWRARASRVAELRGSLRARGAVDDLNQASVGQALAARTVVTGTLAIPTILLAYANTDLTLLPAAPQYTVILYDEVPSGGRPYTLRSLYTEMSNGLLDITGAAYGWMRADSGSSYYLQACLFDLNPLFCEQGVQRMYAALTKALAGIDPAVDLGAFDNDGPDGIPNSGDDDGIVDVVQFVHPHVGGECGGPGYWAHKFALSGLSAAAFETDDPAAGGGFVRVDAYHLVSGVGGPDCEDPAQIMAIGTAAHELGHGLGLPDLYDTDPSDEDASEGIGEWGLMGSGNYTSLQSPAHLSAWSKERLGWVTVRELSATGRYTTGPVVSGDSVFLVRVTDPNPRNEYFLLENKQPVGSDTANLLTGGIGGPKAGGLLVWHIDQQRIDEALFANRVNTGSVHGVRLIEADGYGELRSEGERGDNSDAFPGFSQVRRFSRVTSPGAIRNADGEFAGFVLDSIFQVVPGGEMVFKFATGPLSLVAAADTNAGVQVDDLPYHPYADILVEGTTYTIGVPEVQVGYDDAGIAYRFVSWSDGGERVHDIVGSATPDTIVATLSERYILVLNVGYGAGRGEVVVLGTDSVASGSYHDPGTVITLIGVPEPGTVFSGWDGVPTEAPDTLVLVMDRPYGFSVGFVGTLGFDPGELRAGRLAELYEDTLHAVGGVGGYEWSGGGSGLTISPDGIVRGVPTAAGRVTLGVTLRSGPYAVSGGFDLQVASAEISLEPVLDYVLLGDSTLTEGHALFFDLVGNRNGRVDLGDLVVYLRTRAGLEVPAKLRARLEDAGIAVPAPAPRRAP